MATIRLIPSTYSLSSTNTSYISISNASNMYTNIDSTTYATVNHNRARTTSYYIYVRGYDGGFPHAAATAKCDIDTGKFVETWGFYGCPVTIAEGTYE